MNAPTATRPVLIFLAGFVWSLVGIGLLTAGIWWSFQQDRPVIIILAGCAAGLAMYGFGFSKLVRENIERIYALAPVKDRVCLFAFQNMRSYFIVIIMMALGYTLRHLPISRFILALIYVAIGAGLFISSLQYYRHLRSQP